MRTRNQAITVGIMFMVVCAGCAKKEVVKSDQDIPAQVISSPAPNSAVDNAPKAERTPVAEQKVAEEKTVSAQDLPKKVPEQSAEVKDTGMKDAAIISPIHFDFDSYLLSQESRENLQKNYREFQSVKGKIVIEGHCDERGSDDYNLALGEERARAAMRYLKALGIPENRMSVISYGKERPADPTHSEAAWQTNRRDEFIVEK